jgi:hypothetical protein
LLFQEISLAQLFFLYKYDFIKDDYNL